MKVIGYGWIKAGDTLQKAMEKYGVSGEIQGKEQLAKVEKALAQSVVEAKKEFSQAVKAKHHRKSAKPRFFRVVLEEIEQQ